MIVLVCGGRNYQDWKRLSDELDRLPVSEIIEGGAPGADLLARQWAVANKVSVVTFKADWKIHGRAAGPIRNQQMIDDGSPELVLAFPGGRGTADMMSRATKAGIPVVQILP